jgi:hypothetical protein
MGREILINGEPFTFAANTPTARDIKQRLDRPNDWVMYSTPDGKVHQLNDQDTLPAGVEDVSVVPVFQYGSAR